MSGLTEDLKPAQPFGDLVDRDIWLAFVLVPDDTKPGKSKKIPTNGSSTYVSTKAKSWLPLARALQIKEQGNYPGVTLNMTGGITSGDLTLIGFDFDGVTNDFIPPFASYADWSPSGTGVRMFAWVPTRWAKEHQDTLNTTPPHCQHAEIYLGTSARHLTVTGRRCNSEAITTLSTRDLLTIESWGMHLFETPKPEQKQPTFEVTGTAVNLDNRRFNFTKDQKLLIEGSVEIDRSKIMMGFLVKLLNLGITREDLLATMLTDKALLQYVMDHRNNNEDKALSFAKEEISRAYTKSKPGMLDGLAFYNDKWADKPAPEDPVSATASEVAPGTSTSLLIERPLTDLVLTTPIPPWPSVIGSFLPSGVVTETDGAHGIGKSALGLHAALSVVCDVEYYGFDVNQSGKAVFMSKEDPYDVIVLRIQAWLEGFDPSERPALQDKIRRNLTIYGCDETEGLMLTANDGGTCSIREDAVDLIAERWCGAVLVVMETASLLHGGDELNEDLLVLVAALKRIAGRLKAALNLIRHISKSAAREGTEDSLIGRGGASFSDAVRSVTMLRELSATEAANIGIDLSKLEEGSALLKWLHTKNNYGKKEVPFYILRKPGRIFPRFIRVEPRGELIVNGDRLLVFLRAEMVNGNADWSYSKIKNKSTEHHVPQNKVRLALDHLINEKKIKKVDSTKGGGNGVYVPIQ